MDRRRFVAHTLLVSALPTLTSKAFAQAYPARPIVFIVPFAVGGGSDNVARLVTAKISERTGKVLIVENRGGGGTNIGNEAAARATPDGYTFLLGQFTLSANPHLYKGLRYDTDKSFRPVVHIADTPTVLVVPAASPIKDVAGAVAAAKAAPGKLNFGSGGAGTSVHLAGELFKQQTRTDMEHIPYKGSAPAMADLIGGQIDMMFDTTTSALPHIKGGRVRAIGVASTQRLTGLPDIPTFAEQGFEEFDVPAWYGFVAPAGTLDTAVRWLNTEVNEVLKDPEVMAKLESIGAIPVGGTPEQMAEFMQRQSARWARVIQEAGIKLE